MSFFERLKHTAIQLQQCAFNLAQTLNEGLDVLDDVAQLEQIVRTRPDLVRSILEHAKKLVALEDDGAAPSADPRPAVAGDCGLTSTGQAPPPTLAERASSHGACHDTADTSGGDDLDGGDDDLGIFRVLRGTAPAGQQPDDILAITRPANTLAGLADDNPATENVRFTDLGSYLPYRGLLLSDLQRPFMEEEADALQPVPYGDAAVEATTLDTSGSDAASGAAVKINPTSATAMDAAAAAAARSTHLPATPALKPQVDAAAAAAAGQGEAAVGQGEAAEMWEAAGCPHATGSHVDNQEIGMTPLQRQASTGEREPQQELEPQPEVERRQRTQRPDVDQQPEPERMEAGTGADFAEDDEDMVEEEVAVEADEENVGNVLYFIGDPVQGYCSNWPGTRRPDDQEQWKNEFRHRVRVQQQGGDDIQYVNAYKQTRRELMKFFLLNTNGPLSADGPNADEDGDEDGAAAGGGGFFVSMAPSKEPACASAAGTAGYADDGLDLEEEEFDNKAFLDEIRHPEEDEYDEEFVSDSSADGGGEPEDEGAVAEGVAEEPVEEEEEDLDETAAVDGDQLLLQRMPLQPEEREDGAGTSTGDGAAGAAGARTGRRKGVAPVRRTAMPSRGDMDHGGVAATGVGFTTSGLPSGVREMLRELAVKGAFIANNSMTQIETKYTHATRMRLMELLTKEVDGIKSEWQASKARMQLEAKVVLWWRMARQPAASLLACAGLGTSRTNEEVWRVQLEQLEQRIVAVCREVATTYVNKEEVFHKDKKKYVTMLESSVRGVEELKVKLLAATKTEQEVEAWRQQAIQHLRKQWQEDGDKGKGSAGHPKRKKHGGEGGGGGDSGTTGGRHATAGQSHQDAAREEGAVEDDGSEDGSYESSFINDDDADMDNAGQDKDMETDSQRHLRTPGEGHGASADGAAGTGREDEEAAEKAVDGVHPLGPNQVVGLAPNETEVLVGLKTTTLEATRKKTLGGESGEAKPMASSKASDDMDLDNTVAAQPSPAEAAPKLPASGDHTAAAAVQDGSSTGQQEPAAATCKDAPQGGEVEPAGMHGHQNNRASRHGTSTAEGAITPGSEANLTALGAQSLELEKAVDLLLRPDGTAVDEPNGQTMYKAWQAVGGRIVGVVREGIFDVEVRRRQQTESPMAPGSSSTSVAVARIELPATSLRPTLDRDLKDKAGPPKIHRGALLQVCEQDLDSRLVWKPVVVLGVMRAYGKAAACRWAMFKQLLPGCIPPRPAACERQGEWKWTVKGDTALPPMQVREGGIASASGAGSPTSLKDYGNASYVSFLRTGSTRAAGAGRSGRAGAEPIRVRLLYLQEYLQKKGLGIIEQFVGEVSVEHLLGQLCAMPLLCWHKSTEMKGTWHVVEGDPGLRTIGAEMFNRVTDIKLLRQLTSIRDAAVARRQQQAHQDEARRRQQQLAQKATGDAGSLEERKSDEQDQQVRAERQAREEELLRNQIASLVARKLRRRFYADIPRTLKRVGQLPKILFVEASNRDSKARRVASKPRPRRRVEGKGTGGAGDGVEAGRKRSRGDDEHVGAAANPQVPRGCPKGAEAAAAAKAIGTGSVDAYSGSIGITLSSDDSSDNDDVEVTGGKGSTRKDLGTPAGRKRPPAKKAKLEDPTSRSMMHKQKLMLKQRQEMRRLRQEALARRQAKGEVVQGGDEGSRPLFEDRPAPKMAACFARSLKEHQIQGLRFMWENLVDNHALESLNTVETEAAGGCILAHSMGLGKTLSTICFLHMFLGQSMADTDADGLAGCRRALLVVPANVLFNFYTEFMLWLPEGGSADEALSRLTGKKVRVLQNDDGEVDNWYDEEGSVLLMSSRKFTCLVLMGGFKMFRAAATAADIDARQSELRRKVLDGAGLVVVDEAHELRNPNSQLYRAMCSLSTRRRLALTGYPLQNNLEEYYTMLTWVQGDLLGTPEAFKKEFAQVIKKGQQATASTRERMASNQRLVVLNEITADFVHRAGPEILERELPPKSEVVLLLDLNDRQREYYEAYLKELESQPNAVDRYRLFRDFEVLRKVMNNPQDFEDLLERAVKGGGNSIIHEEDPEGGGEEIQFQVTPIRGGARTTTRRIVADATGDDAGDDADGVNICKLPLGPGAEMGPGAAADAPATGLVASKAAGYKSQKGEEAMQLPLELCERLHRRLKEQREAQAAARNGAGTGEASGIDPLWGTLPKQLFVEKLVRVCQANNEKLVVFSQSLKVLDALQASLLRRFRYQPGSEFFRIDGAVISKQRHEIIEKFNKNEESRVILVSSKAGSLGINLTTAYRMVIFDVPWNPVFNAQAIARIYRFGQARPTFVYRLLYAATLEELVYDNNVDKEELFNKVVDKKLVRKAQPAVTKHWTYLAPERLPPEAARRRLEELADPATAAGLLAAAGAALAPTHGATAADGTGGSAGTGGTATTTSACASGEAVDGKDYTLLQLAKDPDILGNLVNAYHHKSKLPPDPLGALTAEDVRAARQQYQAEVGGAGGRRLRRLRRIAPESMEQGAPAGLGGGGGVAQVAGQGPAAAQVRADRAQVAATAGASVEDVDPALLDLTPEEAEAEAARQWALRQQQQQQMQQQHHHHHQGQRPQSFPPYAPKSTSPPGSAAVAAAGPGWGGPSQLLKIPPAAVRAGGGPSFVHLPEGASPDPSDETTVDHSSAIHKFTRGLLWTVAQQTALASLAAGGRVLMTPANLDPEPVPAAAAPPPPPPSAQLPGPPQTQAQVPAPPPPPAQAQAPAPAAAAAAPPPPAQAHEPAPAPPPPLAQAHEPAPAPPPLPAQAQAPVPAAAPAPAPGQGPGPAQTQARGSVSELTAGGAVATAQQPASSTLDGFQKQPVQPEPYERDRPTPLQEAQRQQHPDPMVQKSLHRCRGRRVIPARQTAPGSHKHDRAKEVRTSLPTSLYRRDAQDAAAPVQTAVDMAAGAAAAESPAAGPSPLKRPRTDDNRPRASGEKSVAKRQHQAQVPSPQRQSGSAVSPRTDATAVADADRVGAPAAQQRSEAASPRTDGAGQIRRSLRSTGSSTIAVADANTGAPAAVAAAVAPAGVDSAGVAPPAAGGGPATGSASKRAKVQPTKVKTGRMSPTKVIQRAAGSPSTPAAVAGAVAVTQAVGTPGGAAGYGVGGGGNGSASLRRVTPRRRAAAGRTPQGGGGDGVHHPATGHEVPALNLLRRVSAPEIINLADSEDSN